MKPHLTTREDNEVSLLAPRGRDLGVGGALLAVLLGGCQDTNTYVEPPPPKVTVAQPLVQEVTDYLEFTGTTVASAQVEVRARVSGVLESMHFQPGTKVAQGDLLFEIDPREYQADLEAAQAELAGANGQLKRADTEYERAKIGVQKKIITDVELVKWRAEQAVAQAEIKRAEAKITRAELNLSYTRVEAPIGGRVGRNQVDIGNLVGEGQATVLTTITNYDPMYVYFNLNERDLLRVVAIYRARVREKGLDPAKDTDAQAEIALYLGLADEEGYPHQGILDFAESGVDPNTGTLQLRGTFVNKELPARLMPGLFARVRLPIAQRSDMPLVSERAIGADQSGQYLLVVNQDNTVEKRNVRLGQLVDGLRVIEEGLRGEDRVIVNGIQRARPGGKVDPQETDMAAMTARQTAAKGSAAESDTSEPVPDTARSGQETQ